MQRHGVDNQTLGEFLDSLLEYQPTIPDELTQHHLRQGGYDCKDPRLVRLVSVAAQRFLATAAQDALIIQRRRKAAPIQKLKEEGYSVKDKGRLVLTLADLAEALEQYGVDVKTPPYVADSASAKPGK